MLADSETLTQADILANGKADALTEADSADRLVKLADAEILAVLNALVDADVLSH